MYKFFIKVNDVYFPITKEKQVALERFLVTNGVFYRRLIDTDIYHKETLVSLDLTIENLVKTIKFYAL